MLDAWEIEPDSELNEEICENLFHEIVVAVELVSSLARAAQAIQITQKVRPILLFKKKQFNLVFLQLDISILLMAIRRADRARRIADRTLSIWGDMSVIFGQFQ